METATYKNKIRRQQKRLLNQKVDPLKARHGKTTKKKIRNNSKGKRQIRNLYGYQNLVMVKENDR